MGMEEIVMREVQERLKNQEIQIWWASLDRSGSLKLYRQIKGSWGEEIFWKVGLSREDLKAYLDWRGNGFLIGEKRKYQGRKGKKVESIACPMCGSQDESLLHFLCECVELNDWRREMYGKEKLNEIWILDRMKETNLLSIKRIARFLRIAAAHRERFL